MWMYGYRIFLEIVLVTYYLLARGALLTTGNFTLRQRLKWICENHQKEYTSEIIIPITTTHKNRKKHQNESEKVTNNTINASRIYTKILSYSWIAH